LPRIAKALSRLSLDVTQCYRLATSPLWCRQLHVSASGETQLIPPANAFPTWHQRSAGGLTSDRTPLGRRSPERDRAARMAMSRCSECGCVHDPHTATRSTTSRHCRWRGRRRSTGRGDGQDHICVIDRLCGSPGTAVNAALHLCDQVRTEPERCVRTAE